MPLATKVDRTPSVPLAMIVAVFTNVRGIACFQIFTPQKPGTGSQKIGSERVNTLVVQSTANLACFVCVRQVAAQVYLTAQYDCFKVHGYMDFGAKFSGVHRELLDYQL